MMVLAISTSPMQNGWNLNYFVIPRRREKQWRKCPSLGRLFDLLEEISTCSRTFRSNRKYVVEGRDGMLYEGADVKDGNEVEKDELKKENEELKKRLAQLQNELMMVRA